MAKHDFDTLPRPNNHEGEPRHVGVEIEYAGPSAEESAAIVRDLFGGTIETESRHRHFVKDTRVGDFTCELDFQYAHADSDDEEEKSPKLHEMKQRVGEIIGDASAPLAPTEITCPPLVLADLPQIQSLVEALRDADARGTDEGLGYAFGMQFNPEIAEKSAAWLTAMLRAYLTLSDWLRAESDIDLTRRLLRFADPFPGDYVALVCGADYAPEIDRLIDDYLEHNPTRNRELDMLPLFAWIDADRVRAQVDDPRIKPRPTFHYRLPDAHAGDPDWSIAHDWNRWVTVEELAEDTDRLNRMASDFLDHRDRWLSGEWAEKAEDWLAR